MKVLLDSLHLKVHTQEFYPIKLQSHKIKAKRVSGSKRVKHHLYHHPKLNDSFLGYFWQIVFIAINIIQNIVFYGKEATDFIHNLCQTKLNDWLGLFYMNSCNWGLICIKFSRKEK